MRKRQDEDILEQSGRVSQDIRKTTGSYTPRDTSGNDYAGMVGMSDVDRAALDAAGKSWNEANRRGDQAGMDAAHQQAESIRSRYNYSGGSDGSQYIPGEDFRYETAPQYVSRYQEQLDAIANQILNREAFTYDPATDPLYQQYAETYTREGQRAMKDTLGEVAARTGGLASSYATTAAAEANNYHVQQLADKVPELRDLAYSMYINDLDQKRADLSMLMGLESSDYGRYADQLDQFNTDRNFAYGQFADDRSYDYGVSRDQVEDQRYADELAWERENYQNERDYERAAQKAETLAAAGDFSGYRALGYSDQEIAALQRSYQREKAAGRTSGRGSSGGSSATKPRLTLPQTLQAIEDGVTSQQVLKAYEYYYGEPYVTPKNLTDLDVRNEMYGQLGDMAKQTLSNIQRGNSRNGQTGITDGQKVTLEKYVTEGQIEDWELGIILDLLGY